MIFLAVFWVPPADPSRNVTLWLQLSAELIPDLRGQCEIATEREDWFMQSISVTLKTKKREFSVFQHRAGNCTDRVSTSKGKQRAAHILRSEMISLQR